MDVSNPRTQAEAKKRFSPSYLKNLFDEMSETYGGVNLIASFGFTTIWRKCCVQKISKHSDAAVVVDYMTGAGELIPSIQQRLGSTQVMIGIDFSPRMCELARANSKRFNTNVEIREVDALNSGIQTGSVDYVFSSFGLKTFSVQQQTAFAHEINRVLKPGGSFSFIEISIPKNAFLRFLFTFYIKNIIPSVGRLFLGNPSNYRDLFFYTKEFVNCTNMSEALGAEGLKVKYFEHFFGCATGVRGSKPFSGHNG